MGVSFMTTINCLGCMTVGNTLDIGFVLKGEIGDQVNPPKILEINWGTTNVKLYQVAFNKIILWME